MQEKVRLLRASGEQMSSRGTTVDGGEDEDAGGGGMDFEIETSRPDAWQLRRKNPTRQSLFLFRTAIHKRFSNVPLVIIKWSQRLANSVVVIIKQQAALLVIYRLL